MPPCTHCEYTRCPKCGHDCGQAPVSSQGSLDDSIPSARLVYRNDDRPTLDSNELQQADALMSIFNLRRVSP